MNAANSVSVDELDVFACPLDGVNQIEASAGTGKTWNICALYVRLLLEKKLAADAILVVTFTKAATAELHERIRSRLVEIAHALETGDTHGDAFLERLFSTTLLDMDAGEALKRVNIALHTFDQAAIHTIHAFCQRALQEAPFAAAMPFAFDLEADDSAMRFEMAADFWRERVEPLAARDASFAAWLVSKNAGPASLDAQLSRRLKKPLAVMRWGASTTDLVPQENARSLFSAACALWHAERDTIVKLLRDAEERLNKTTHKVTLIEAAIAAWTAYFADNNCHAAPPKEAMRLTASALKKGTKGKHAPPEHAFFEQAETLAAAAAAAEAAQRSAWLGIVREWLDYAPPELAARKRTRRVVSFDDLLANLHQALMANPWLADALRARYPAALIDEFQDTDPLQFAIFKTIFSPQGPLFLVGDPKQAIYSFRAADLHTYLAAREAASARYTLAENQRSTRAIIDACNRVFSANPSAFILDGLDYHAVRPGQRQRLPFSDTTPSAAYSDTADFCVWMLPHGDGARSKTGVYREVADACAAEIVRLLKGAQAGEVMIGDAPLAPGQIAVLVQTHRQGSLIKRVLTQWGVGSVELAQASVFGTIDAEQIERVLAAIDTPGDLRRLRAALATDWLGLDAAALWTMDHGEGTQPSGSADAMSWVERFSRYRMLWHERGFAVMWRTLVRELMVAQRLVAGPDGERRLTNVNHLAELLQARGATQPGIAPTLRWLAAQRMEKGGGEEAQLRLESDRNLVQIVTVHKSKGLEYAVVFCPFLNDGALRDSPSTGLPDAREYHDEEHGSTVLHYGYTDEEGERASGLATREQAAERARLIYVALTRAVYRCYVVAGVYLISKSSKESRRSVLNWLVAGAGREFADWLAEPPEETVVIDGWQALGASSGGSISVEPLPQIESRDPLIVRADTTRNLQARTSRRVLRDSWRTASFSSLIAAGARAEANQLHAADDVPDHDGRLPASDLAPDAARELASELRADDILAFPRGPSAGECLHRMYELADFTDPSTWSAAIDSALHEHPVPVADASIESRLLAMMATLLADTLSTELVPGLTLDSIPLKRRMNELEFLFPAESLDFAALRRVLAQHGFPDVALEAGILRGFVKGFIDMIVEHDGRFWIVDWKSNHLGDTPADYDAASVNEAMASHAYHLQALFYVVALHRYLRLRIRDYAFERHIGGYLYLFIRGVRPDWRDGPYPAGVHVGKPSLDLIDAIDTLMLGVAA